MHPSPGRRPSASGRRVHCGRADFVDHVHNAVHVPGQPHHDMDHVAVGAQLGCPGQLHDAVAHEPGDGSGQQEVVEVLRAGYRWKGRVLRPAMVKVRG